jgi:hypothetical protein
MDTAISTELPGARKIRDQWLLRPPRDKKVYIARNRKLSCQVAAASFQKNAIMPTTSRELDHTDEPNQRKRITDIPADWTEMPD